MWHTAQLLCECGNPGMITKFEFNESGDVRVHGSCLICHEDILVLLKKGERIQTARIWQALEMPTKGVH